MDRELQPTPSPLRAQTAADRAGAAAANAVEVPSGTFLRTQSAIDRMATSAPNGVEVPLGTF
jgi:hypothetical protein